MKKMIKLLTIVAAAAMGLTSCQNGFDENNVNGVVKGSVTINFVSEEARTSVDTSGDTPLFAWGEEESFEVLEQTDALVKALSVAYTNVGGKANIDAEFALNTGKDWYKYVAVYPKTGFVSAESINTAVLALPSEQSAVEGSYDPNADLMVSMPVTTAEQPTESQPLRFTRVAAVVEMSINNLTLAAGEEVKKVDFTANGKTLAGSINADLVNPHEFSVNSGISTVSVATTSANKVYFTVLPTTLDAGDTYSVAVLTNKQVYIKQGTIPAEKSLKFEAGKVSRFGVNMTDAVVAEKWRLVRDASTLKEGDVVTIVSNKYDYVVGANTTSNYPYASKTTITKIGDYFIHPTPANATKENMVQQYTLVKRDANRNAFDFYNGTDDYSGDANSGFLCIASSKQLKLLPYYSVNTQFDITIENGIASIIATNGTTDNKKMIYNHSSSSASSRYFCCYSSTDEAKAICLYRLEGAEGEIPTVDANIEVPNSDIVITEDGVDEPTVIEKVVFNYVGNWNIKVEANKEWLDVVYDAENNCLKYTAEKNADPKRTAEVTITATLGDKTLEPWTFNMLQKGAPVDYTIEEFAKLDKDENSSYRLTGKVTKLAENNSTKGYDLSDENDNTVTINYLKDEKGNAIFGHDNISIQLGDVMTVVTVPAGSKKGGINNTSPSIYKGHYRLTATAGVAADYTGGAVAIEVATSHNGSIELPTTPVSGTMAPCDYATFAYTDGAASATVTFTSQNDTPYARTATATFTYGLTSAEVTVQQGVNPANKIGWKLVTDASTLAVGDEVIIVAKNADKALAKPTSTSDTFFPSTDISKTGSVIYDIEEAGVQPLTLGAGLNDGTFSFDFTYNDTGYRLYYNSGLKMRTTSYAINAATSWTISIEADGNATITSTRLIKFNEKGANGGTFTAYATDKTQATADINKVCIYKKEVK